MNVFTHLKQIIQTQNKSSFFPIDKLKRTCMLMHAMYKVKVNHHRWKNHMKQKLAPRPSPNLS